MLAIFGSVFGWFFRGVMDKRKRLSIFRNSIHIARLAIKRTGTSNNPVFSINEDWPSRIEDIAKVKDSVKKRNIENFHKHTYQLNSILDGPTQRPQYVDNKSGTVSPSYNDLRKKIESILTKIESTI